MRERRSAPLLSLPRKYACDWVGFVSVKRQSGREGALVSKPSECIYTFDRAKWSKKGRKEREREGEEEKISCQLFLHKILDFSLL